MNTVNPLKVLIVASEVAPFAKSGGLGDVTGTLPKAIREQGVDIRVVLPKYKTIKTEHFVDVKFLGSYDVSLGWRSQKAGILEKNNDVPTYFIENDYYFARDGYYGYNDDNERFAFFSKAVLDMLRFLDFYPDIIHCNDWQTGPIPMLLKENYSHFTPYKNIKTLYTIHNLQYQGRFSKDTMEMLELPWESFYKCEYYGVMNYMKAGLTYSDKISTVSKTYAEEIKTSQYGYGLEKVLQNNDYKLCGILNGIDYKTNNPETDSRIYKNFGIDSIGDKAVNKSELQKELGLPVCDAPVISIISRLADQKGLDLLVWISDYLMQYNIQLVILGTGEKRLEDFFKGLEHRHRDKVRAKIMFDDVLAQRIYAGSDMFLMPSSFEPCGLGQMFSLRYGTVPIVRKTGGLSDTVHHFDENSNTGNGFVFEHYTSDGLLWAIKEALRVYENKDKWNEVVKNALESENSWAHSAKEYIDLYEEL